MYVHHLSVYMVPTLSVLTIKYVESKAGSLLARPLTNYIVMCISDPISSAYLKYCTLIKLLRHASFIMVNYFNSFDNKHGMHT